MTFIFSLYTHDTVEKIIYLHDIFLTCENYSNSPFSIFPTNILTLSLWRYCKKNWLEYFYMPKGNITYHLK